jgi:hypothetical protein
MKPGKDSHNPSKPLKLHATTADKVSMNGTQTINLTETWEAKRDRYAKRQGSFILEADVVLIGDDREVWDFMRACGDRIFRVVYRCLDGTVRDMIGRQGVYKSEQDGHVQGIGHAMQSETRLNLSFWTFAHGEKVNTGSGAGYRTLKAAGILAIRCEGHDILTAAGQSSL